MKRLKRPKSLLQVLLSCTVCGTDMTIFRSSVRTKQRGHIKHLWCFKCKRKQAFIEKASINKVRR